MINANLGEYDKTLRQEIIESQKTQADFLKWKLISVAAVASISLGLTSSSQSPSESAKLLFCIIPLLCAYVDLISIHIMIRIITIGIYLKISGSDYERFVFDVREKSRANPFVFEAFALHGSSLIINLMLIALVIIAPLGWLHEYRKTYVYAGLIGIVVTVLSWAVYNLRARKIMALGKQFKRSEEQAAVGRKR